jgi:DNA-binding NtrC family response regulator
MKDQDKTFLVVDDEQDMCWALEHMLKKNGFLSKKALNGREALTLMEPNRFRLVLLDAKLPDIDGLELARLIRRIDPSVGIVMISGYFYGDDEGIQQALAEGLISGFIAKPFRHDEIMKVIQIARSSFS